MIKIENEKAIVQFETKGAQITSFKMKGQEFEYMWQPEEPFWQGRNPILFPIVGSPDDKIIRIDGQEYTIGNHGFARDSEFQLINQQENWVAFRLQATEKTRKQYPFEFTLDVIYTLNDCTVDIHYEIHNHSDKMMPFTFGLHPAFTIPFEDHQTIDDCWLRFGHAEPAVMELAELNSPNGQKILLSEDLFDKVKTLLFENLRSISVTDRKSVV